MEKHDKEVSSAISEIREWLVRLDTKLDYMQETHQKADRAEGMAEKALNLAEENKADLEKDQKERKIDRRWLIGTVISVVGLYLKYLI